MALFELPERRSVQQISDLPNYERFFSPGISSSKVTRQNALKLSAVYSCVDAISSDISGVPIHLLKKTGKVVEVVIDHPAYDKLKLKPNNEMNAKVLRDTRSNHVLLEGNSYLLIERSFLNPVKNLWLLDPDSVTMFRTKPKNGRRGVIKYEVEDGYKKRIFSSENIIHIKGTSWNGLTGESVITTKAREVLSLGLDMDQFTSNFFKNGMNPGGIMTHPKSLGENKESFIDALKKRFSGNHKSRLPMVLEDGMEYKPFEVKMADQEFLERMKLNRVEICGMFGVPPSRISISDSNTNYNNSEQENKRYVQSGLLKWAIQDEQEMNLKLLTPEEIKQGYYFKYNFSALLRGDSKDRAEVHEKYWRMGVPLNTILEKEDQNPVEGGDDGRVQLNTISLKQADSFLTSGKEQKSKNNILPEYRAINAEIAHRQRVKARFAPLINAAAQKLVNRESIAIKKESKKQSNQRSESDMRDWLNDFYSDFGKYIDKELSPILRAYAEATQEAVAGEVDAEIGVSDELETEIDDYIEGFKDQYIGSSRGQMLGQLDEGGFEAVDQRADEWHEKTARKVELSESNGMSNMVASFVIAGAGFRLTWRNVGPTCDFCKTMEGKTVARYGQPFLNNGHTIDVGGDNTPMTVRTTKYPPLHNDCDCVISAR